MNVNEDTLPTEQFPPSPTTAPDLHPPSRHQPVLNDDFEPDDDSNGSLGPPEAYDEDLERSAEEEEDRHADENSGWFLSEEHCSLKEIKYGEL